MRKEIKDQVKYKLTRMTKIRENFRYKYAIGIIINDKGTDSIELEGSTKNVEVPTTEYVQAQNQQSRESCKFSS